MKLKLVGAIGVFALLSQTFLLPALADETKLFPSLTGDQGQTPAVSTIGTPEIKTITTATSSTNITTSTSTLRPPQKIEQSVQRSIDITDTTAQPLVRVRIDQRLARKMAKDHWLEKAVAADPSLIDAITQYSSAAKILAKHPRIGTIAEADHYTCRNITRWKTASRNLARNPEVKEVIDCDPEGIYRAIKRDSKIGKLLVKQPDFNQIIVDNPELGKLLATHM
ncbi:MAG: hypothetical protein P4L53_01775 [Candidatus Obscuribacterales bacterium]|nr:hypothetical protein [Candidatus Obscuribacterales bacterium]